MRVDGDSMNDAGIHDGDLLVVDRAAKPVARYGAAGDRPGQVALNSRTKSRSVASLAMGVMRSAYRSHYRAMLIRLLNTLEFRSNNDLHRPVLDALALVKKYAGSGAFSMP